MRKAVVFACDWEFLPYTIFSIRRIRLLEPNLDCDICLCSSTINNKDYSFADEGIIFHNIDLSPVSDLKTPERLSISTYTRLLLPDHFHERYDRILYLDGDTYLRKPGLAELLALEMDGYALAAAKDAQHIIPFYENPDMTYLDSLGMNGAKYQNSGVLLIDVHEFRRQKIFQRVVDYARANSDKLQFADQSAINATLLGDWLQISCRWNFQRVNNIDIIENAYDPIIIHFCGPKPWEDTNNAWLNSYRDKYVTFLSKEFPEFRINRKLEIVQKFTWRGKFQRYKIRKAMLQKIRHFEADCKI